MNSSSNDIRRDWLQRLAWSFFGFLISLLIGYLVFALTRNAVAGAGLPAVWAGWESFRTGIWILQSDRNVPRGRVCSAFCFAAAFWQAAAAAFFSVIVFVAVANLGGGPPGIPQFAAAMTTLAGGVVISTFIGLMASIVAVKKRIRIWVNPLMRKLSNGDLAKVVELHPQVHFNYAVFVMATSVSLPVVMLVAYVLISPPSPWFSLAVMILGPAIAIIAYLSMSKRIIATSPAECWGN